MKKITGFNVLFLLFIVSIVSCKNEDDISPKSKLPSINVTAPECGFIYLDGQYTGSKTPCEIPMNKGKHLISVALEKSWKYLRKEIEVVNDSVVQLVSDDQPKPKVWKALWIGVSEVTGNSATGYCSSRFSKNELDAGYDFFQWSIENHFEKFSYGTMKWEVTRKDISTPIELHKTSNTWFTLEPSSIMNILPEVQPGVYDAVFVFWRESEGSASFKSSYFGLAWTDPLNEPIKTGYITVKFDAGTDINQKIAFYKNNDPGVWVHEWLHTVGENYFQRKGYQLPTNYNNDLAVHAAEKYGYTYPWMNWYLDFMSGRVVGQDNGSTFVGIGPEAFLKSSVRESAVGN
jgi:hypothetical protein